LQAVAGDAKLADSQMKGEATAYLYANGNWRTIYMPNGKKPWSDARVRRAIFIAIDRKQALETVDKGLGSVAGVLPPSMGGLTPEELKTIPGWREPKSVDVAEAKKLLAEAGFPKGFKTDIFYRSGGDYLSMATFLKDQLAPLGIDATLSVRTGAAFYDYSYARSYDLFAHRHPWAPPSPDAIVAQYYRSGGARNFSDVADPKLDEMIDRQMSTLDWQERKKQLRAIEMYLYDNAFASVSHWGSYPQAWQKWVRDFVPGESILSNVRMEAVWLDR
ncbi:MAG: ABC transporter substrate-binding protein, partial [Chloroflexota bacterium]